MVLDSRLEWQCVLAGNVHFRERKHQAMVPVYLMLYNNLLVP